MKKSTRRVLLDYSLTILLAAAVAFSLRNYGLEAYRIPSFTMSPSLLPGDIIFVGKWHHWLNPSWIPSRGEIVVFTNTQITDRKLEHIKRVVGIPGDQIEIQDGKVILNGKPISSQESLPPASVSTHAETVPGGKTFSAQVFLPLPEKFGPFAVPPNSVFVLGDLRSESELAKKGSWGIVPVTALRGKALWIWLSISPKVIDPQDLHATQFLPKIRFERMFKRVD